jgi:hypothetical protein
MEILSREKRTVVAHNIGVLTGRPEGNFLAKQIKIKRILIKIDELNGEQLTSRETSGLIDGRRSAAADDADDLVSRRIERKASH